MKEPYYIPSFHEMIEKVGAGCVMSKVDLAINHFSFYLYGQRFKVVTDHKGLVNMREGRQENRRIHNWCLKLAMYDFEVEYRAGKENVVADDLSRCHEGADDGVTRLLEEGGDVGRERPT